MECHGREANAFEKQFSTILKTCTPKLDCLNNDCQLLFIQEQLLIDLTVTKLYNTHSTVELS